MPARKVSQTIKLQSIVGVSLLVAGLAIMLAYSGVLGLPLNAFFNSSPADSLDSCVGLGLASLHLVQSVAFNHGVLLSFVRKMLVLFSAFAVIVAGLALLQNRAANTISGDPLHAQEPGKGDQ
jgi:hypothetical protein